MANTVRGSTAPIATGPDQRKQLDGSLGDANFQKRALSQGRVQDGHDAGVHEVVRKKFKTSSAQTVYEIQHDLGHVAGKAIMVHSENPQNINSHYSVRHHERDKWTTNTVRVHVFLLNGSMDGGEILLEISGEQ